MSDFIHRTMIPDNSGEQEALSVTDIQGVVALVQSGVLEMHVWGATLADLERPDRLIFDFDPGEGVEWPRVIEGALARSRAPESHGSGKLRQDHRRQGPSRGRAPQAEGPWKDALAFTRKIAEAMAGDEPDRYTTTSVKQEREGRIFIDYLRNNREASAVAPYSTRSRPGAPVATPVAWEELTPDLKPNGFTVDNLGRRLASLKQDPWADMGKIDQVLPEHPSARTKKR